MHTNFEKIILITRKTALEELTERFATREQAKFYIARSASQSPLTRSRGKSKVAVSDDEAFAVYQQAHDIYHASLSTLRAAIPSEVKQHAIDRSFLPNFVFGPHDLVLTLGQDGLVVNTAKYLHDQPLIAFNPDPARVDGVLLPFEVGAAQSVIRSVLQGNVPIKNISMAKAQLSDGQSLYALNDLFIGPRTHQSARYTMRVGGREELQSSSGVIVSTGAGSTGWFRSILTGAAGVVESFGDSEARRIRDEYRFDWESDELYFSVREPFISRTSGADIVFGKIVPGDALIMESQMPQNGVIFSDGIETDYLDFNSGTIATIGLAERKLRLVIG